MGIQGKLSSIALPDLLQNLEQNGRTGTLSVRGVREDDRAEIYVADGKLSMLSRPGRPTLADRLVRQGVLTADQLERAKHKRKGTKRALGETLEVLGLVTQANLREIASEALREDVCDLVADLTDGEFSLDEGNPPARVFDPEERRLRLAVSANALLLEAARRRDMWVLVRQLIPSDSIHFYCPEELDLPADFPDRELAVALLPSLDGSHSVEEVVERLAGRRFAAYTVLAELVRQRLVRAVSSQDLLEIAKRAVDSDPKRARALLVRGLEAEPHHRGLLELHAKLAEQQRDRDAAADCHKRLAHLALEHGDSEESRVHWSEALRLAPKDSGILERCLEVAMEEDRRDEALQIGMKLVDVYRGPGLHRKCLETLQRLEPLDPGSPHLAREIARTHVEAGAPKEALAVLAKNAKSLLHRRRYGDARELYVAILDLDPQDSEAAQRLAEIDSQTYARRRARVRAFLRRAAILVFLATLGTGLALEARARIAFAEATRSVAQDLLIEDRRYDEAKERLLEVADEHPWTATRWFDIARQIEDLDARIARTEVGPLPPAPNEGE